MRAPNIAYRFSYPRDTSGPTLELFSRAVNTTAAVAAINELILGIPQDRALIITNVSMAASPNAVQGVNNLSVSIFSGAGFETIFAERFPPTTVNVEETLNWSGEIWTRGREPGGASIRFIAGFSGALANQLRATVHGFVIPRGNVAPF